VALIGLVLEASPSGQPPHAELESDGLLPVLGLRAVGSLGSAIPPTSSIIYDATPNDFWAVHDLLLLGFDAYFMKEDSEGKQLVQQSALDLASLMQDLHPHEPCRKQISADFRDAGGIPGGKSAIIAASAASWACLPARYDCSTVKTPFVPELVGAGFRAQKTRMSAPLDLSTLGVCRDSAWPRTCSYWVSMHTMAYRADALGKSARFLRALLPVLAGGVTMCGGCTLHLHALHRPVLPLAVLSDLGGIH